MPSRPMLPMAAVAGSSRWQMGLRACQQEASAGCVALAATGEHRTMFEVELLRLQWQAFRQAQSGCRRGTARTIARQSM
jgi:hypothetical protein